MLFSCNFALVSCLFTWLTLGLAKTSEENLERNSDSRNKHVGQTSATLPPRPPEEKELITTQTARPKHNNQRSLKDPNCRRPAEDNSGGAASRVLELTSQDCTWRTKKAGASWSAVDEPQLLCLGRAVPLPTLTMQIFCVYILLYLYIYIQILI